MQLKLLGKAPNRRGRNKNKGLDLRFLISRLIYMTNLMCEILDHPVVDPGKRVYHVAPVRVREAIAATGAILPPYRHQMNQAHWMSETEKVYFWPTLRLAYIWMKFMETSEYHGQHDIWACETPWDYEPDTHWEIEGRGYKTVEEITVIKCLTARRERIQ